MRQAHVPQHDAARADWDVPDPLDELGMPAAKFPFQFLYEPVRAIFGIRFGDALSELSCHFLSCETLVWIAIISQKKSRTRIHTTNMVVLNFFFYV